MVSLEGANHFSEGEQWIALSFWVHASNQSLEIIPSEPVC